MSRLRYFVRETLISLRRNVMMTIAGIMTVFISLMLFGGILVVEARGRPRNLDVAPQRRARSVDGRQGDRIREIDDDQGRARSATRR